MNSFPAGSGVLGGPDFLRKVVLIGFGLSGITGLVYQGVWIRMLTLVVGGTTGALTTVLIAFMGGLALGSFVFGPVADRTRRPLRAYALLEVLIGMYALGLPWLYQQVPSLYRWLHATDPNHGWTFQLLRFALALLFFGIPSTFMGGTLPLVVRAVNRLTSRLRTSVAEVYAVNTLGATFGAFLTGFIVLPEIGMRWTLIGTALGNILLGGFFLLIDRKVGGRADPVPTPFPDQVDPVQDEPPAPPEGGRGWMALMFFLMGASSLSYEVLWHRVLGLSFGNSVYSVSTMLTGFLLGIAAGSWWLRRVAPTSQGWTLLGWIELGIAITAPLTAFVLTLLPHAVQYLFLLPYGMSLLAGTEASDTGFWLLQFSLFVIATGTMLIPTSLMGASFPLAVELYGSGRVGRSVGAVYASNTLGSIVGLTLTGFVGISWLGTEDLGRAWSVVNGALACIFLWQGLRRRPPPTDERRGVTLLRQPAVAAVAVCLPLLLTPSWNLDTLTSGVYYHIAELSSPSLKAERVFQTEDDMGLVSLHKSDQWDHPDPALTLKVNGKFMAGSGNRLPILHQFAHIPIFLRGEGARTALVIGLGGGYTVEAVLQHPFERVDSAEISEGVIQAAHLTRPDLFKDPRHHPLREDARTLLLGGSTPYDVIVSETSDPWMSGVANLYTQEFFQWVKGRLAVDGVFGTWLQTRHKAPEDVRIILRTMQSVFPHFAVFVLAEGDTLLVMSPSPLSVDVPFLYRRHAELAPQMDDINLTSPWSVMARLALGPESAARYLAGAAINTDDLPIIEFNTPRTLNIGLKGREIWDMLVAASPAEPDLPLHGPRWGGQW